MSTYKSKTTYTSNLDDLFLDWGNLFSHSKQNVFSDYTTQELEDGRQEVTLNVLGHDPKNINIQATSDKINIKSHKPKHSSALVNDVDFTLTISGNYDGTTAEAKFNNGLLILTIDKKEEKKEKTIQIKVV